MKGNKGGKGGKQGKTDGKNGKGPSGEWVSNGQSWKNRPRMGMYSRWQAARCAAMRNLSDKGYKQWLKQNPRVLDFEFEENPVWE